MAAIIAFILLRPSTDMEGVIMALLTYLTPDFDNIDFSELAKIEPILTASELLKTAGEENDTQRAQVSQLCAWGNRGFLINSQRLIKHCFSSLASHMGRVGQLKA